MAVQHQLGTGAAQHRGQCRPVGERLAPADRAFGRRMMQGDDAQPAGCGLGHEHLLEPLELGRAEPAASEQRRGRQGRVEADQRQGADAVHERPALVAARPVGPMGEALRGRDRHQRVVVARHQAEGTAGRERTEPFGRLAKLGREREVGDVAGDDDVVDSRRTHVRGQGFEDLGAMQVATAAPRQGAELALGKPLAQREPRLERKVQVGDVGQRESVHRQCLLPPGFRFATMPELTSPLRLLRLR